MKDNKEHENLSKNLPQKKDISEDKTDATEKETIRSISPSVVPYTKDGKGLLVSRIALDQFCTCNKSPVRWKGYLNGRESSHSRWKNRFHSR